ncbi:uncharacterized protein LOC143283637 [Babylonia areolata]|uniref:uncharacterized protein LOC143283637 n=1 Tax=Babylonia areolata TaxID=304850 RepID=UPI003FD38E63
MSVKKKSTEGQGGGLEVTFDAEEAFTLGCIPLDKLQAILKGLVDGKKEIHSINFKANGYCTDAVLQCISTTLKNAKGLGDSLKEINLLGCGLITDSGLCWMASLLQEKCHDSHLSIKLDGCVRITDSGVAMLKMACPNCQLSAMATSIVHLRYLANASGCPLLLDPTSHCLEKEKKAQLVIIPLKTKDSLASYLLDKKCSVRKPLVYLKESQLKDWTLNLLEIDPEMPLFEHLVSPNPTQVLIPFSTSLEPAEVRDHIADTISLVLSKESINPEHPTRSSINYKSSAGFIFPYSSHLCRLSDDGVFQSITDSDGILGMMVSRQPLSRSHPFFEVECLGQSKPAETGFVLGCMHDTLMSERFPMESKERSGGAVEGFELDPGSRFGFGVEGHWLSEYVPSESAVFYFTKNGEKMVEKTTSEKPHIGMYPLVSVLGKSQAAVKIHNFDSVPEELLQDFEEKQQYHTHLFSHNMMFDEEGVLTYLDNRGSAGEVGVFITGDEISKTNTSCSIRIMDLGQKGTITLGLGPEKYPTGQQPGWKDNSIAFHGDDAKVFHSAGSGVEGNLRKFKVGDVVTVSVAGFQDYIRKGDSVKVTFSINGLKSKEYSMTYNAATGIRCVFMIGMHSAGEKAQLLNYRSLCMPLSPHRDMLTMGRSHYMNIMDDGTLSYRKFDRREFFGLYVSKTPLSSHLHYFELEVENLTGRRHMGIGLCHAYYPCNQMVGWRQGSIGYHADNGQLYCNNPTGTSSNMNVEDACIYSGDVIGCGIDISKAQLKPDGSLQPQQTLLVYFTKNGTRVHETKFTYNTEGLYPAVNLHFEDDKVRLRNYHCSPESLRVSAHSQEAKEEADNKAGKEQAFTEGCHFLIVGMSSDGTDPMGKTQLVQQMFDPENDLSALKHIKTEISRLESNLGSLDLQSQQGYSRLLWQQQCLHRFIQNKQRLTFLSLNAKSGEGHGRIVDSIMDTLEMDLKFHSKAYEFHSCVSEYLSSVLEVMKSQEILISEDLFTLVDHGPLGGNGRLCEKTVQFLQKKGYLMTLPWKNSLVALDMDFVVKLTDSVGQCPIKPLQLAVPALGEAACVWDNETHIYPKAGDYDPHRARLLRWALQYFGVMRVPNVRMSTSDHLYLFLTLGALGAAPVTLDDFRKEGDDRKNKMVVMQRTYHFLHSLTNSLLAFILTRCARFSRPVLLRQEGGVFQSGAVQTVVKKCFKGQDCMLLLESFCYLPGREGEAINQETHSHVTSYTWNIFCILADIIDIALIKLNIPVIISNSCPPDLVNTSIGCIHNWHSLLDEDDRQTVCTLCNMCCEHGSRCEYKGMPCQRLRQSACGTKVTGCKDCGICKSCADELWTVRTFLRPCCEVSSNEEKRNQRVVPLNSTTFDEVSCTNFDTLVTPLCLQKTDGGSESLIQVFPGPAVEIPNFGRLGEYNKQTNFGKQAFKQGDMITVKLESLKMSRDQEEEEEEEAQLEIKPVYHTIICSECHIWHDTGILCYSSSSSSVPVSQFVGERPLTRECNRFSFEIINEGRSRYIAIGLCHRRYARNRQPGWDGGSIGYHADDGGIFVGSGWPATRKVHCHHGDIMACELDLDESKVKFYKNNELVYTSGKLRVPAGGFHPFVGMHSVGEAVKLLQKEPWLPSKDDEIQRLPDAFDCYKYGNLWISPGNKVHLVKIANKLSGWVMLHNPSRSVIGYQVDPLNMNNSQGTLKPGESRTFYMQINTNEMSNETLMVKWLQLDSEREYTEDDLSVILHSATSESLLHHRLAMKVFNTQQTDITELKKAATSPPDPSTRYMLEVLKNGISVDKYWLKGGNFSCVLPFHTSAILTYPKFPTLDTANVMSRGMRLVAKISTDVYAECVVVSVSPDRKNVTLEYSQANEENNTQIELPVSSPTIQLKEIPYETIVVAKPEGEKPKDSSEEKGAETSEDKAKEKESVTTTQAALEILGYSARGNFAAAKSAYMYAPFHLLSEASQQAIKALDPDWLKNSLQSVAHCSKVPSRITVQELQITALARKPSAWVHGNNAFKNRIGETFAFLPASLNWNKMCYPIMPTMFTDIDVHRLCMLVDQKQILGWHDNNIDEPIHFVDIPPIRPANTLPDELLYACMLSGWTYTALVAKKLLLPQYDMIFSGGKPAVPRAQVESAMTSLLSVYASLCNIYAEQCGGLEYQIAQEDGTKTINATISHDDDHAKTTFTSSEIEDPHCVFKRRFYLSSKVCFTIVCKAHLLSIEPVLMPENAATFSLDYYDPYGETVNAFERALHDVKALPDNFFKKFHNLQVLELQECEKLTELPSNISGCRQLEKMVLADSEVKTLPADLFEVPELMVLVLKNLPLTSLPNRVPTSSWLTVLVLRGLQLREIPPALGNLTELTELDLNYNPLTDLPMELQKLQRLRSLQLCGMPWLTMEGNKNSLPLDKYSTWFDEHPYLRAFLGQDKILKLFTEFDHNKNAMLDTDEIAALNAHLFWDVPRVGSKDINDEEYGGIPPVVFTLSSLEELKLDFQAITAVPVHMCRLQSLAYLSLAHNPLLESLPGSLGHLPSLKQIRLVSCPSLRTPPNEVVSRGMESVKAYLKRLAGGFTECRRTKLMFVGLGGAGKTSLLRALMSAGKKTEGTKGENITDGIVIQPWTVKNDAGVEVTYSTWDFAGQTLYYNTHQFFLSKRAVYLLLWSTRQGFEHAGLDFWLSSVASHAPKTPIFVVGTHCDQVPKADVPMADLKERYPQIAGFHFVSSVTGTGIEQLEKEVLRVTLEQKNMGEKVPQVWLSLEKKILQARLKDSYLEWGVIRNYGMEIGIYDEKDTKEAIQFLHELGTVQYFDNDFLRNIVVIDPQWIVDVMSCVVSVKNSPIQEHKGRLLHRFIPDIWSTYRKDLHQWLLQLTEEFDLTFPLPKDNINIVPCLLPQEEPSELVWPSIEGKKNFRETKMVYKFAYLPAGLFNRAQVRLFQFSDGKLIWKRGSLLKKNKHMAIIRQISDCELLVKVQGPRPENIVFLVHEVIESLIEESFHGVQYDFLLPCPDCITKEGTLEPCLFEGSLVKKARDHRAPFLQCRKYFHTISMAQLQEVMPADSASDFDAHLQHSIMSLQQLNSDMAKDVAILYSAWDIPANNENDKVHPAWVKEDLEKQGEIDGYTVWYPEDVEHTSVEDMMMALKNCKVVVALVSDNFEQDKKSNDLLMYTMDTLNKPYVIVVIRPKLTWTNTDLGMRIGKQEIMVMVKTKDRYKTKVQEDLFPIVQQKLHGVRAAAAQPPVCFLSYCWTNSHDAYSKGTSCPPSALGWGDPRHIKQFLEKRGITCWLDIEQTASGVGLFKNITQGMRQAQILVACVSDEYVRSENCMMELRFGVLTLHLPLVVCVVGTGREWKESEVGILMHRSKASKVYFQTESETAHETLLSYVKDRLTVGRENKVQQEVKQHMKELKAKDEKNKPDKTSFNEEYELTQRKFMRHIISFVSSTDSLPMPRLLVLDFDRPALVSHTSRQTMSVMTGEGAEEPARPKTSGRPGLRPKTSTRTRDRMEPVNILDDEENWEAENFCLKLLCENEEGWHLCPQTFSVKLDEEFKPLVRRCSAYLARLYAILQQSAVHLSCFVGKRGKKYREWIEENAVENPNFIEAFSTIRMQLAENRDADGFLQQMCRCHLPSGKTYWLCTAHQDGPRITKLSTESTSRDEVRRVLFEEDVRLKEVMETSEVYRRHRAKSHKKHSVVLPAKVAVTASVNKTKAADSVKKPTSQLSETKAAEKAETTDKPADASTSSASAVSPSPSKDLQRSKSVVKAAATVAGASASSARKKNDNNGNKSAACSLQ